ncbi:MAG TPA: hypothetical protein VNN08_25810 [Thermoanaerobaculia bacterium]|nr:hypothetical protein [Thermoanaerobaculia bacterium]
MMRIVAFSTAVFLTLVAATVPGRRRSTLPPQPQVTSVDPHRSFAVTDTALLAGFTFQRVLDQLVARGGVPGLTSAQLYRQWFDTQNAKPGMAEPTGPHCDDFTTNGSPSFNGFPRRCPTFEGTLAAAPFTSTEYFPIAVVNRFDQAPADGSNCGQFRLIFARRAPLPQRLHIIFEPVLRNPNPSAGLAGCRAVAQFWAGLTNIDSPDDRRARLESFYFDGLTGFPPVIDPPNFDASSGGGIRTTEVDNKGSFRMYQFYLTKDCSAACTMRMTPDVLHDFPFGPLFDSSQSNPQTAAFQDAFVEQVPNLAVRDVNEYFMEIPREFLMAESDPTDSFPAFFFAQPFERSKAANPGFYNRIQGKLTAIGSTLTPDQIVLRAETQNCVGCHLVTGDVGEGVVFPHSFDSLQQVADNVTEPGENGPRFMISPALRDVFIPHRMKILMDFLNSGKAPVHSQ